MVSACTHRQVRSLQFAAAAATVRYNRLEWHLVLSCICCAVGDDEGGTSFLANLHNQQRKLDNLGPSKAADNKSTAVPK